MNSPNPLHVIPLGGLGEIGKNMMALEYEQDIIVIDCGVMFHEEDMPGVDLVIPDISYLTKTSERDLHVTMTGWASTSPDLCRLRSVLICLLYTSDAADE